MLTLFKSKQMMSVNDRVMVYAAPMNENYEKAVWATGRSPLLDSCISWFKSIFTVNINDTRRYSGIKYSNTSFLINNVFLVYYGMTGANAI